MSEQALYYKRCLIQNYGLSIIILYTGLEKMLQKTAGKYCVGDEVHFVWCDTTTHTKINDSVIRHDMQQEAECTL